MKSDYLNRIIHGDCLSVMKNLPDDSIDVTFADPPFNLKKKYDGYKDNLDFNSYLEWCEKWIFEMVRITKPTGSIFIHNIPKWLTYFSEILNKIAYFKHWISWDAPTAPEALPVPYSTAWPRRDCFWSRPNSPEHGPVRVSGWNRLWPDSRQCRYYPGQPEGFSWD